MSDKEKPLSPEDQALLAEGMKAFLTDWHFLEDLLHNAHLKPQKARRAKTAERKS